MDIKLCDADVKKMIDAGVSKAVIQALGINKEAFIASLVKRALEDRQYSQSPTYFQLEVEKAIRSAAVTAFQSWAKKNEPLIAKAIQKKINEVLKGESFADLMAERFIEGFGKSFTVNCRMTIPNE